MSDTYKPRPYVMTVSSADRAAGDPSQFIFEVPGDAPNDTAYHDSVFVESVQIPHSWYLIDADADQIDLELDGPGAFGFGDPLTVTATLRHGNYTANEITQELARVLETLVDETSSTPDPWNVRFNRRTGKVEVENQPDWALRIEPQSARLKLALGGTLYMAGMSTPEEFTAFEFPINLQRAPALAIESNLTTAVDLQLVFASGVSFGYVNYTQSDAQYKGRPLATRPGAGTAFTVSLRDRVSGDIIRLNGQEWFFTLVTFSEDMSTHNIWQIERTRALMDATAPTADDGDGPPQEENPT